MIIITAGCSLEKQSGFNRTMQNLTAHYNILFNAREILRQKQVSYASAFVDNYNELLNVYPDTTAQSTTPDKDLEEAIAKANKIINIKEQSHYQGDAYLVLGKANYLEGNYFNAIEFLNYVIKTYPTRMDLVQDALAWKARSSMYLGNLPQAKLALDTAIQNIDPKKNKGLIADIYASKLQYDINVQDYADGEEMAKQAISHCHDGMTRLRWTFILSQLQELNQKPAEAVKNYNRIASSNVSFEMAFNASLNRIRIEDAADGIKTSRTERLMTLLKEPNNKEFKDQIYYQVAQLEMSGKNIDGAIKNYKLSVRTSVKNQNQKGLSYLRLAEIYFKNKADYLSAKKYYDSTVTTLPVNYPGYAAVKKISVNLQLLANNYQIILREDTLQALAKMDEGARNKIIDKMVTDQTLQQQADLAAASLSSTVTETVNSGPRSGKAGTGATFYFYNNNAVSQGYGDFKRKWGDRKLEDNWRRSSRSNSDVTANQMNSAAADPDAPVSGQPGARPKPGIASGYRKELLDGLPLTSERLAQSNVKIYNAYTDIGNFYRDVLGDKKEAINIYELILRRFPNDPNIAAVYYSLYRLYSDVDKSKSDHYKDLLLKNYADTPFAKIISDPDFAKKLEDQDAEFTQAYNKVFDLYAAKKYSQVITGVPQMLKQYPGNKFGPQLYYLKTIAEGHNEKVGPFTDSLKQIVQKFPDDKLITPLVSQQLTYINTNQAELLARPVVLTDDNPLDLPFTLNPAFKEETAYRPSVNPFAVNQQPQVRIERQQQVTTAQIAQAPKITTTTNQPAIKQIELPVPEAPRVADRVDTIAQAKVPAIKMPDIVPSIFLSNDSTNYYFAVNVKSGTTNLASSRFGFGQFNRAMYAGKGIKHQLLPVGADNQVIYVGRFYSLADVKKYARAIVQLLPDIMKVPKDKYSFFIITQENLNKLADAKTLDSYIDYYQRNF
ncbi:tetratricopeptide repeat protein [Mucilaginibacter sp. BJC16-A38]|uniref:type IX secretion system periplasmic lipoprotein PorW/SprE n=1 Tax=Mucilaginibacter phenanthrenivorans TaxID=1234842 RepID=UPI002157BE82|nr:tetratricopeptide repeat protein [Mucilaginibacter phenanthrenivorans]MCR8558670.1 tetratricopeptide repeat protein [Mucilaginibacter phenanthrenivorans]